MRVSWCTRDAPLWLWWGFKTWFSAGHWALCSWKKLWSHQTKEKWSLRSERQIWCASGSPSAKPTWSGTIRKMSFARTDTPALSNWPLYSRSQMLPYKTRIILSDLVCHSTSSGVRSMLASVTWSSLAKTRSSGISGSLASIIWRRVPSMKHTRRTIGWSASWQAWRSKMIAEMKIRSRWTRASFSTTLERIWRHKPTASSSKPRQKRPHWVGNHRSIIGRAPSWITVRAQLYKWSQS